MKRKKDELGAAAPYKEELAMVNCSYMFLYAIALENALPEVAQ